MRLLTSSQTSVPPSNTGMLELHLNPLSVGSAQPSENYAKKHKTPGGLRVLPNSLLGTRSGTWVIKSGPHQNSTSPEPLCTNYLLSDPLTGISRGTTPSSHTQMPSSPALVSTARTQNISYTTANQLYRNALQMAFKAGFTTTGPAR